MKIRSDFVSNSSSSSFIVACEGSKLGKVIKDIANACCNKTKSEWHDPSLKKRNLRILNFCINTYQLMFLGNLLVKTKTTEYSIDDFKRNYFGDNRADTARQQVEIEKQAKLEFERYKKNVDDAKKKNAPKWMKKTYGRDQKIDDKRYLHYYDLEAHDVVISNNVMDLTLSRYHIKDNNGNEILDDEKTVKQRVENMLKIAEEQSDYECGSHASIGLQSTVETYSITLDTIANTRELIDFGFKIEFDEWEDLDKLEEMLKSGKKIFYARQAYQGDGYCDFCIYCEDGVDGISDVKDIEVIGGEC